MSAHVLLVYDRTTRALLTERAFRTRAEALRARLEAEGAAGPGVDVIVLSAASPDVLRTTHGRYFTDPAQLAAWAARPS